MNTRIENSNLIVENIEKTVLSIIMHSPRALHKTMSRLQSDCFAYPGNKKLYLIIQSNLDNDKKFDYLLLQDYFNKKSGKLGEDKKFNSCLTDLYEDYVSDERIDYYLDIIVENHKKRQIHRLLNKARGMLISDNTDLVIQFIEDQILEINKYGQMWSVKLLSKHVDKAIKKIERLAISESNITGLASGFPNLDNYTFGFQKGDLTVIAGRPSMGKTAFALNIALNIGADNQKVAFFSLEMPFFQILNRAISQISDISLSKIRTGTNIKKQEWDQLNSAKNRLLKTIIFVDDAASCQIYQTQSILYRLVREKKINIAFFDYLQLMSYDTGQRQTRDQELTKIIRLLKSWARELKIPIVCISQLSRSVEKRENKRPIMSDLRDSGSIEQVADLVFFLYSEEYYKMKELPSKKDAEDEKDNVGNNLPITELIIAKHRNGATGKIKFMFERKTGSFLDF